MESDVLIEFADRESHLNRHYTQSLIITLESLPLDQILSTDTFDGICAWSIYIHVIGAKEVVLKAIDPSFVPPSRMKWFRLYQQVQIPRSGKNLCATGSSCTSICWISSA